MLTESSLASTVDSGEDPSMLDTLPELPSVASSFSRDSMSSGNPYSNSFDWYAEAKLRRCEQRLKLGNPAHLMCEEVETNSFFHKAANTAQKHRKLPSDVKELFVSGKRGRKKRSRHACVGSQCHSIEEQVSVLFDMSSDPVLLCRLFVGWRPFL